LTSSKSIHPYVLERIKARETGEMEAVVSASTGALQAVLPKLINLLTEEYKLHKGAKEGIRYIKSELVSMQVALEKAAEVSDQQVKLWARELRDMSYAIEDTIDSYMVRVGEPGSSDTTTCSPRHRHRDRAHQEGGRGDQQAP
jgi:hypothetical protein